MDEAFADRPEWPWSHLGLVCHDAWPACVCAEGDRNGHPLTYQGGAWMGPKSDYIYGGLTAVGCAPNSLFCFAVGGGGGTLSFSNYKWSYADPVGGGDLSVSCPTVGFCMAVDYGGNALTRQGGHWSDKPISIDAGGGGLTSVSCASASFCAAVDMHDGITYNGRHWMREPVDGQGGTLQSVSCPSKRFCVEVDYEGDDHRYINGRWTRPNGPDAGREPHSVSCVSARFCAAVGLGDGLVFSGGTDWTRPKLVNAHGTLNSVSCPTTKLCIAVDVAGNAVTYSGCSENPTPEATPAPRARCETSPSRVS